MLSNNKTGPQLWYQMGWNWCQLRITVDSEENKEGANWSSSDGNGSWVRCTRLHSQGPWIPLTYGSFLRTILGLNISVQYVDMYIPWILFLWNRRITLQVFYCAFLLFLLCVMDYDKTTIHLNETEIKPLQQRSGYFRAMLRLYPTIHTNPRDFLPVEIPKQNKLGKGAYFSYDQMQSAITFLASSTNVIPLNVTSIARYISFAFLCRSRASTYFICHQINTTS